MSNSKRPKREILLEWLSNTFSKLCDRFHGQRPMPVDTIRKKGPSESEISREYENTSASEKLRHAQSVIDDLQNQLSRTRSRPLTVTRHYLQYHLMRQLSSLSKFASSRRSERFERKAKRYDPFRSLAKLEETVPSAATDLSLPAANPEKRLVLVVTSDAAPTVGPMLALSLIRQLSKCYDVVSLVLSDGQIADDFRSASFACVEAYKHDIEEDQKEQIVQHVARYYNFEFALVSSIESRSVLSILSKCGVPTVWLVNEFCSHTWPRTAFTEGFQHATETVFSTEFTRDNALDQEFLQKTRTMNVVPHGKYEIPELIWRGRGNEGREIDQPQLALFSDDAQFLIIGTGSIEFGGGVDLFIDCAARLVRSSATKRFRFIWFGDGYDLNNGPSYSAYISDQIKRAGVAADFQIVPALELTENVWESADLLMLTARLDALPSVAITAMQAGLPIVCFEHATGIADYLAKFGLADACLARHLDTSEMADKVLTLATNDESRNSVAIKAQKLAMITFDMENYVERIEAIGLRAARSLVQYHNDASVIRSSGVFRDDFFSNAVQRSDTDGDSISKYLRNSANGSILRKPAPGFQPGVFSAHFSTSVEGNEFANFLRKGRPAGSWSQKVIQGPIRHTPAVPTDLRYALHLHVFYSDLMANLLDRISINTSKPDLFVSTTDTALGAVREALQHYDGRVVDLQIVPNRGRDIGPFLTQFGQRLVDDYDVMGHLHTKKSEHLGHQEFVEIWNTFLLENLIGGQTGGAMMDAILGEMGTHPDIGLVYPDDPHILGWTENRKPADALAKRLELGPLPDDFNFPIGTMFWVRNSVLRPFVELGLSWSDYPTEPIASDGTMLHALERLFGVAGDRNGSISVVTNVPNVTR